MQSETPHNPAGLGNVLNVLGVGLPQFSQSGFDVSSISMSQVVHLTRSDFSLGVGVCSPDLDLSVSQPITVAPKNWINPGSGPSCVAGQIGISPVGENVPWHLRQRDLGSFVLNIFPVINRWPLNFATSSLDKDMW